MKPIKPTAAYTALIRKSCVAMLDAALKQPSLASKFNFAVDLKDVLPKYTGRAELIFTAKAYAKMICMVMHDTKEVAVHGTVRRCTTALPDTAGFFVDDVFVYPQEATAATVEASDSYGYWLARQPAEIFNHLRFQAHSHVNMGVSPSTTDETFYRKLMMEVKDFYIFIIINRRLEVWCEIYDIENNLLYEQADISTNVLYSDTEGDDTFGFTKVLKEMVVPKVYNYSAPAEKKTVAPKAPASQTQTNSASKTTGTTTKKKKKKNVSRSRYTNEEFAFMAMVEALPANALTQEQLTRYMTLIER